MDGDDFEELVSLMQKWADPNGPYQQKYLKELAFGNPVAVRINMKDPAPDGDFEILFVRTDEIEKYRERFETREDTLEVLSFEEGMRLAQREDCSGGPHIYQEGLKMIALNPALLPPGTPSLSLN